MGSGRFPCRSLQLSYLLVLAGSVSGSHGAIRGNVTKTHAHLIEGRLQLHGRHHDEVENRSRPRRRFSSSVMQKYFSSEEQMHEYVENDRERDISPEFGRLKRWIRNERRAGKAAFYCPSFTFGPNKPALATRMASGREFVDEEAYNLSRTLDGLPRYLFVSGPAYGGTTAFLLQP